MDQKVGEFLADPVESDEAKAVVRWQFRLFGDFYKTLFDAIVRADEKNLDRLAKGFPVEVAGYRAWAYGALAAELRSKGVMD